MLYYLAIEFKDQFTILNVFTYNTVRAGGAALTGFFICLIIGPMMIRWLRALKVGQFVRQEHVEDLHELHKGKSGTPTMGGSLIVLSAVATLLLWGRLSNPSLLVAMGALCGLGAVGFMDDFIKLRRKHNQGLTARAKFIGQIGVGLLLGLYVLYNPITTNATTVNTADFDDWQGFIATFHEEGQGGNNGPVKVFWDALEPEQRRLMTHAVNDGQRARQLRPELLGAINRTLTEEAALAESPVWAKVELRGEAKELMDKGVDHLEDRERRRLNRLLFEAAFPGEVEQSPTNPHTNVNIPGFKDVWFPLGAGYILFAIVLIVASSNAVNLTDGLDGLAVGASIISVLAFTGIAYVVSRVDWSDYLLLTYVPEATELAVFGGALLGTGLGFLWYNAHPAEVFMGDTGSLALGGAIGTMAMLTKQELLLLIVGGLFVLEAGSVIIQVASFKLRGTRVFRMAPLHHHFELKGWSENKVIVRFWIIAIIFALMSLSTLKLR